MVPAATQRSAAGPFLIREPEVAVIGAVTTISLCASTVAASVGLAWTVNPGKLPLSAPASTSEDLPPAAPIATSEDLPPVPAARPLEPAAPVAPTP